MLSYLFITVFTCFIIYHELLVYLMLVTSAGSGDKRKLSNGSSFLASLVIWLYSYLFISASLLMLRSTFLSCVI